MELRTSPLVLPACGLIAGAGLAFHLIWLPIGLLAALFALGVALRGRPGIVLAALAGGLLWTSVVEDLPRLRRDPASGLSTTRPVEVEGTAVGYWRRSERGWRAPFRLHKLRQGHRVSTRGLEVVLFLPGEEPPPPVGARLRLKGILGRSPGFANGGAERPGGWRLRIPSRRLMVVMGEPSPALLAAAALRGRVERAYSAVDPGVAAGPGASAGAGLSLARALMLGDRGSLPPRWVRGLRRVGLGHLLALSGLHVALVGALAGVAAAPLRRGCRPGVVLLALLLYVVVAGPRPSLLRAALMAVLALLALSRRRPPAALNALALAVLVLLAGRPSLVGDLGFRLTVAATGGILTLTPLLEDRLRALLPAAPKGAGAARVGRWLVRALAVTLAAQAATFPLAVPVFGFFSPAAPVANLVAVPWCGLTLALASVFTVLAVVAPPAASWLLPLLDGAAAPWGWPASLPPSVPFARPIPLGLTEVMVLTAVLSGALIAWIVRRRGLIWSLAALAAGLLLAWPVAGTVGTGTEADPEVVFLDVGQGDAILLRDGRRAMLVDGGGWVGGDFGGRVLLPALNFLGVDRLEAMVLSHGDLDHCGGLVDLVFYLPVGEVLLGAGTPLEGCAGELAALHGAPTGSLAAGSRGVLGGWRWRILHPQPRGAGSAPDSPGNRSSVVMMAETRGVRLLLTGDLDGGGEGFLARRLREALRADILKVSHHGSRSSSHPAFLAFVRPRLAVISAGRRNPYGHPAPEVVDRLRKRRSRILRTDRDGMIRVRIDRSGGLHIELPGTPRREVGR